ncbi:MAG: hypothetical protein ING71_08790, partial [Rhodocyclaceae bacterium]|nr:hypothetical protein [Rhodocyclaceae bacterium]
MSIRFHSQIFIACVFISTLCVCGAEAAPQPVTFQAGDYVKLADPSISLVPGNVPLTTAAIDLRGNGKRDWIVGMGVPPSGA